MKQIAPIFFSLLLTTVSSAQCLDTLQFPDLQPPCNPFFLPVCGCDGITYRTACYADFATVLQYSEGPCEQVILDFYPNPVTEMLFLSIVTKWESNVNLYIFDRNGNIYYYRYLTAVTNEYLTIPVNGFQKGMYIVMAESNGQTYLSKLIKWE